MAKVALASSALTQVHLVYHSSGLVAVGVNSTTLTIERNSNPQTSSFSSIGTGSTACDGVCGIHLSGDDLHIVYVEITTGKTNTLAYNHRVFDLGTDSWAASATAITSATTELTTTNFIQNALAAFSNGELVCVLQATDGADMGNATFQARWWTWTSGGGWVDEGAAHSFVQTLPPVGFGGTVVGDDIAQAIHQRNSVGLYSTIRQSDKTIDAPTTTTDNVLASSGGTGTYYHTPTVSAGTPDEWILSADWAVGGAIALNEGSASLTPSYTGYSVGTTELWSLGHVRDSSGYLHILGARSDSGNYILGVRKSTNADDASSWGSPTTVYDPTANWTPSRSVVIRGFPTRTTRTSGSSEYAAWVTTDPDNSNATTVWELEVVASSGTSVTPSTATLSATGYAPTVEVAQSAAVTPSTASVSLTAYAPTATATDNKSASPQTASVSVTAFAPSAAVTNNVSVTPQTATASLTGYAPTVAATANVSVTPQVATASFTAYAPTVDAGANVAVTPTAASLSLTSFAPTVAATANVAVSPSTASASLTAYAPSVVVETSVSAQPSTATLSLAAFAPVVSTTADVSVTPYTLPLYLASAGNLARWSEDFSQASWNPSGTILTNNAVSPFGGKNADTFTTAFAQIQQSLFHGTGFNSRPMLWSLYVGKSTTGNGDCRLNAFTSGGTSASTLVQFDRQTGTFFGLSGQASTGTEGVDYGKVDVNSDWWRIWVRLDFNADNTGTTTGFQSNWSGGVEDTNVWGAQRTYDYLPVHYGGPTDDNAWFYNYPCRPLVVVNTTVVPQTATASITAYAPSVATAAAVTPSTATVSVTGYAPTVDAGTGVSVSPQTATLSATAYAPPVDLAASLTPQTATASVTAYAPSVDLAASVQPSTASASFTTYAPVATATTNATLTPQTASATLTAYAPGVSAVGTASVQPSTANTSVSTYAPTVTAVADVAVQPSTASALLTTYAVSVATTQTVDPNVGRWILFEAARGYLDDGTINVGTHAFKARILSDAYTLDTTDAVLADLIGAQGTDQPVTLATSGSMVSLSTDVEWQDAITNGQFAVVYDDTAANDELLAVVDFGASQSVPAGTGLVVPAGDMYWR